LECQQQIYFIFIWNNAASVTRRTTTDSQYLNVNGNEHPNNTFNDHITAKGQAIPMPNKMIQDRIISKKIPNLVLFEKLIYFLSQVTGSIVWRIGASNFFIPGNVLQKSKNIDSWSLIPFSVSEKT
jgi:hypothetical protein